MGEHGDVRDVVGVHDGEGVVRRRARPGPGRRGRRTRRPRSRAGRTGRTTSSSTARCAVEVVGVELDAVRPAVAPGVAQPALGLVEVVGAAGGEHHPGTAGGSRRATARPISLRPPSTRIVPLTPRSVPAGPSGRADDEWPGYLRGSVCGDGVVAAGVGLPVPGGPAVGEGEPGGRAPCRRSRRGRASRGGARSQRPAHPRERGAGRRP